MGSTLSFAKIYCLEMNLLIDSRWASAKTGIGQMYNEIMLRKPNSINISEIPPSQLSLGSPFSPLYLSSEILKSKDQDLFWSPSFMPPLVSKIPFIFTIHDLQHLYFYKIHHALYYKHVIGKIAKNATKVITVSNFAKQDIVEKLKVPETLIEVVYNGVDQSFFENEEVYTNEKPYFLYVGNKRGYKNVEGMLKAFHLSGAYENYDFLLSGEVDDNLGSLINQLKIQNSVKFLGFIEEKNISKLYKGAFATFFASKMEGFGLPILESMASGTPVITSNVSALPEVAGGNALECDPYDVENMATVVSDLINKKILDLDDKIKAGKEWARKFSWDATAQKTWSIISRSLVFQ